MNYPEKKANDKVIDGLYAAAQLIPFGIGGAIAEAINSFVPAGYENRRDNWFRSIAVKIDNLPAAVNDLIKAYFESEEGKTLLIRSTISAISTHKESKIDAIRNVLLGVIQDGNMYYDQKEMYISVISSLEPYDLVLLKIMETEKELFGGIESYEDAFIFSRKHGFKGERDEFVIIINRLKVNSLIRVSDHVDGFPDVYSAEVVTTANQNKNVPKFIVTEFAIKLIDFLNDNKV